MAAVKLTNFSCAKIFYRHMTFCDKSFAFKY